MQICKNIAAVKNLQQLAVKVFNREIPGQMPEGERKPGHEGVVLFTGIENPEYYCWKNELRDPNHEEPGAVAIDFYGNIWIAVDGNDYDGAERWELYHAQHTYRVHSSVTGTAVDTFCPVKAGEILAQIPEADHPRVIEEVACGENLDQSKARLVTCIALQQAVNGELKIDIALPFNDKRDKALTAAYLQAKMNR